METRNCPTCGEPLRHVEPRADKSFVSSRALIRFTPPEPIRARCSDGHEFVAERGRRDLRGDAFEGLVAV